MINVGEAIQLVKAQAFSLKTEKVPLEKACGKVLAEPVRADRDYPPFNRSAMDGFAICSTDFLSKKAYPIAATIFAGDVAKTAFRPGDVVKIMTGAPVPPDFDAVIRVEDAVLQEEKVSFELEAVQAGQNISLQGEDLRKDAEALPKGTLIGPAEVTLLASLGKAEILVYRSPKVVIISTGNEVKPLREKVLPHQIRDSNSFTLAAFFYQMNIFEVERYLVEDEPDALRSRLGKAMDADIVILSGGVSMGEVDYVPATLQLMGVENIFHKVRLKPGKPLWFGKKPGGAVVFGLPGNPFSSQATFKLFIEPFLMACYGMESKMPLYLKADFDRGKKGAMEEYFPCKLGVEGGESVLRLCNYNGSGDVTATALSDGLACQPSETSFIKKGDLLAFYPWK